MDGSRMDGPMLRQHDGVTINAHALDRLREQQYAERRQLAEGYRAAAAVLEREGGHAAAVRLLTWEADRWDR